MKITEILSDRHYNDWPSWQIVYEWEDEIAGSLDIPVKETPNQKRKTFKEFLKRTGRKIFNTDFSGMSLPNYGKEKRFLYFEMKPKNFHSFSNHKNAIPVIIDFWEKEGVEDFKKYYSNCSHLLVTSLEVMNFLKENNFRPKLIHFPMSLPDKYKLSENEQIEKKYDVILAGRTNPVLADFFETYRNKHPELEYVYREQKDGKFSYYSSKTGLLGDFESREAYSQLLSRSKIAFYSTPGMDDENGRTGGFNPVTPRLFEILAAGCHVLMRYPENEETQFFDLPALAASAADYNLFEQQMDAALKSPAPIKRNSDYLENHYTSRRLEILKKLK